MQVEQDFAKLYPEAKHGILTCWEQKLPHLRILYKDRANRKKNSPLVDETGKNYGFLIYK